MLGRRTRLMHYLDNFSEMIVGDDDVKGDGLRGRHRSASVDFIVSAVGRWDRRIFPCRQSRWIMDRLQLTSRIRQAGIDLILEHHSEVVLDDGELTRRDRGAFRDL